jgi:hypothetical protein
MASAIVQQALGRRMHFLGQLGVRGASLLDQCGPRYKKQVLADFNDGQDDEGCPLALNYSFTVELLQPVSDLPGVPVGGTVSLPRPDAHAIPEDYKEYSSMSIEQLTGPHGDEDESSVKAIVLETALQLCEDELIRNG